MADAFAGPGKVYAVLIPQCYDLLMSSPCTLGTAPRPDERFGVATLRTAFYLAAFATIVVAAEAVLPRSDARMVAAVFAPTSDMADIAARLDPFDGRIVRMGGLPNIAIVAADRPDLAASLYRAGAWLVLDPRAGGCWDEDTLRRS